MQTLALSVQCDKQQNKENRPAIAGLFLYFIFRSILKTQIVEIIKAAGGQTVIL